MKTTMPHTTEGFTLIEALVALVLLSLLVLAVVYPMTASFNLTRQSKNTLQITTTAQRDLETARQIVLTNYKDGNKINHLLGSNPNTRDIKCENVNLYNQTLPQRDCRSMSEPPLRRLTLTRKTKDASQPDLVMSIGVRP